MFTSDFYQALAYNSWIWKENTSHINRKNSHNFLTCQFLSSKVVLKIFVFLVPSDSYLTQEHRSNSA